MIIQEPSGKQTAFRHSILIDQENCLRNGQMAGVRGAGSPDTHAKAKSYLGPTDTEPHNESTKNPKSYTVDRGNKCEGRVKN